ncbi:MAG: hypothetical protein B7Z26_05405 [Asticcacaulis sp. 32-58-5]|nr:MAG: hypothetical protein B7Z26_05405 [Asticcacaulis sp. 32-58-5]
MEVALSKPVKTGKPKITLTDDHGAPQSADIKLDSLDITGNRAVVKFTLTKPDAKLWDLEARNLYRLRFEWPTGRGASVKTVRFGFRWFVVDGVGTDALLRLNGKRIKLYSAISWGYWAYNGMWPTKALSRREVEAAQALGLNCLHAHRNVGKHDVFTAQDELGLMRVMEPGGGRHAIGKDLKPGESLNEADQFSRDFMFEKCVTMAKTFRSHPSLAHYTLQNEIGANLQNPDVQRVLKAIHDTDPSRTVILNDGFVKRGAAQAIRGILGTIGSINNATTSIAGAVDEQTAATGEIAQSVTKAARFFSHRFIHLPTTKHTETTTWQSAGSWLWTIPRPNAFSSPNCW